MVILIIKKIGKNGKWKKCQHLLPKILTLLMVISKWFSTFSNFSKIPFFLISFFLENFKIDNDLINHEKNGKFYIFQFCKYYHY